MGIHKVLAVTLSEAAKPACQVTGVPLEGGGVEGGKGVPQEIEGGGG